MLFFWWVITSCGLCHRTIEVASFCPHIFVLSGFILFERWLIIPLFLHQKYHSGFIIHLNDFLFYDHTMKKITLPLSPSSPLAKKPDWYLGTLIPKDRISYQIADSPSWAENHPNPRIPGTLEISQQNSLLLMLVVPQASFFLLPLPYRGIELSNDSSMAFYSETFLTL